MRSMNTVFTKISYFCVLFTMFMSRIQYKPTLSVRYNWCPNEISVFLISKLS